MSSYLEGYGAGVERRIRIMKWLALAAVTLIVLGIVAYFQFRDYTEEKQVQTFLERLRNRDYTSAYALWGCTEASPCRNYPMDKFMEDWGPSSPASNVASAVVSQKKSCATGIIQFVEFPGQPAVQLWVDRSDKFIGFAPWPVCDPRMKAP